MVWGQQDVFAQLIGLKASPNQGDVNSVHLYKYKNFEREEKKIVKRLMIFDVFFEFVNLRL